MAAAKGRYSSIVLNPPKGKHTKEKLNAYKKHWAMIAGVRDKLSDAYIHENIKLGKIAVDAEITFGTVKRFFEFGKGHGKLTYSYFHGPSAPTVFGIASAIGYDLVLKKRTK